MAGSSAEGLKRHNLQREALGRAQLLAQLGKCCLNLPVGQQTIEDLPQSMFSTLLSRHHSVRKLQLTARITPEVQDTTCMLQDLEQYYFTAERELCLMQMEALHPCGDGQFC